MITAFYIASAVAVVSGLMVISRKNAFSALLYMIISLLSVAIIFFILGAAFVAALEIIIYAGAIMVLFIFVVMMLNLGRESEEQERKRMSGNIWIGPSILALVLATELVYLFVTADLPETKAGTVAPEEVGMSLFGPYIIGVELAALLLMAGIIGAYHLGKRKKLLQHRYMKGGEG